MKVTRYLKVPLGTRNIQLVINIPEATSPPPPAPTSVAEQPRPSGWAHVRATLKFSVPVLASVAAIVVSIFALNSQQSANQAAANQIRQQQASHVTYTLERAPKQPFFGTLAVQNTSSSPVYSIVFGGKLDFHKGSQTTRRSFWVNLRDLQACQIASIDMDRAVEQFIVRVLHFNIGQYPYGYSYVETEWVMYFNDRNGVSWMYSPDGGLQQRAAPDYVAMDTTPTYKAATGCS